MRLRGFHPVWLLLAALLAGAGLVLVIVSGTVERPDPELDQDPSRDRPGRRGDSFAESSGDPAAPEDPPPSTRPPSVVRTRLTGTLADLPERFRRGAWIAVVVGEEEIRTSIQSDGSFEFYNLPAGRPHRLLFGFGAGPAETTLGPPVTFAEGDRRHVDLTLEGFFLVECVVTDPGGRPIRGVQCTLVPLEHDWRRPGTRVRGKSDREGRILLVEPSAPVDRALNLVLDGVEEGYLIEERPVRAPSGGVLTHRVVFARGLRIAGRVLGPDGRALAGVEVHIEEDYRGADDTDRLPGIGLETTDAEGRFSDDAFRPGLFRLLARGEIDGTEFLVVEEGVEAGREDVTLRFRGFGSLTIHIRDAITDEPVPVANGVVQRVYACVGEEEDYEDWASFTGKGVARIDKLPAGQYRICCHHRGYRALFSDPFTIEPNKHLGPVEYRMDRSSVPGR